MNKISILIPVYNEKNTLQEILKQVEAVDFGLVKEIILIDDFSLFEYNNVNGTRCGRKLTITREFFLYLTT